MKSNLVNIAFVSAGIDRGQQIKGHLRHAHAAISEFNFDDFFNTKLKIDAFDLIIIDFLNIPSTNIKNILRLRLDKRRIRTPFLFILTKEQSSLHNEIFRDERSGFIREPFEKFDFLSQVRSLITIGQLEKRISMSNTVLESEKKLIHYLDAILQIPALSTSRSTEEFFFLLQTQFTQRMELTFAVEMVLFLEYSSLSDSLILKQYSTDKNTIKKKVLFSLKNSEIKQTFLKNTPMTFEAQFLLDPIVQELEEAIEIEINSLLFAPLSVLQKPRGGFALINKLYRKSFSENDIALSLITIYKLIFQLENLYLQTIDTDAMENGFGNILRTEQDIRESLYKSVWDTIKFGLIVFDESFKIIFINHFAESSLGIIGDKMKTLTDALGEQAFKEIKNIIEKNELPSIRQEMMVNRSGDRPFYMGYSVYEISVHFFALTFMEISQTKRLQAEIIRMDRMASLGVLASGVAHEIRNPLAGIKAMAQTLEEDLAGDTSRLEYVERIVRQVNRLDELLKSFFSYAKPQRPNPVRCKISEIVHEVLPLFRRKIKDNNIVVKERYSRDLKEIFVDFHQIEQVIFNLVLNAIDAMENGGELKIEASLSAETQPLIDRRRRIPKLFSDVYNEIVISDSGAGMDPNTINNMYNPFYTTKTNGTGLGLSIVYQIILEHGGQITVDSESGKGTSFKILLPIFVDQTGMKA
jgi:signal transduction histidine kinase